MKLIKQAHLAFRRGSSDKVYEVDLCEVGTDQYVVNFRYGRRGATLRDGSKTVVSVPRAEAERVFDKLVAEKVNKGYQEVSGAEAAAAPAPRAPAPAPTVVPAEAPSPPGTVGPRDAALLQRIALGEGGSRRWPIERAIWRAGEVRLRAAEPHLLRLFTNIPPGQVHLRRYCLVWALGRCGSARSLEMLKKIYEDGNCRPATRHMAAEALRALYHQQDRTLFVEGLVDSLPGTLVELCRKGPPDAFFTALWARLEQGDPSAFNALHTCYLIDNEVTRSALLRVIREAPLSKDYFRCLRELFKCAEFRHDAEVFGLLAHRFETSRPNDWRSWRQHRNIKPFSRGTKQYLRLRTWRTLSRMSELEDPDWVKMAVGVLLPFTDEDAREGSKLRMRVITEGYDSSFKVQFPKSLREEGARYIVQEIRESSRGSFYRAFGDIKKLQ